MAEGSEMKAFVFCVVYIIVFTSFVSSIPAGFLGDEATPSDLVAIDPNIISGFADSENYTPAAYSPITGWYEYTLAQNDWIAQTLDWPLARLLANHVAVNRGRPRGNWEIVELRIWTGISLRA